MILIESLGVNDTIVKYTNIVEEDFSKDLVILKNNLSNNKLKVYINNSNLKHNYEVINKTYNLKDLVDDETYNVLPINKLNISYHVIIFDIEDNMKPSTKGQYNFNKQNIDTVDITITIKTTKKYLLSDINFTKTLHPIIHELNHALENYKLIISNRVLNSSNNKAFGLNNFNTRFNNNNPISEFLELFYLSFKHEFNARIPQIYNIIKKEIVVKYPNLIIYEDDKNEYIKNLIKDNKEIINNTITNNEIYNVNKRLLDFNSVDYLSSLKTKINIETLIKLFNELIIEINNELHIDNKKYKTLNNETDLLIFLKSNENYFKKTATENQKRIYRTIPKAIRDKLSELFKYTIK